MITVVLAGSLPQFRNWCRENEVNPRDQNVLYVTESHQLRGLGRPVEVVVYGTFWNLSRAEELYQDAVEVSVRNEVHTDPDPPRPWSWTITSP